VSLFALIGANALWLLYAWLLGAIVGSYLSDRKGYGEKAGLVTGLVISALAILVWLLVPAKSASRWKLHGPFGSGDGKTLAEARAEQDAKEGA